MALTHDFQRYAVYFLPGGGFGDRGAEWLGYDVRQGREVSQPGGLSVHTARPARYGFHATIKAPFRLCDGKDAAGLSRSLSDACAALPPVRLDGLEIAALGRFLALVPTARPAALIDTAATIVRDLDGFRAPSRPEELEKRRGRLSERQERNLLDWGYPHVMEDFRFHITLTERLAPQDRDRLKHRAEDHFAADLTGPLIIDSLSLVGEDADGRFHEIERLPLTG
jgi:hypothetical protein